LEECSIAKSKTLKRTIASYLIKARETIKKRKRKRGGGRQRATLAEKLNL
jgi:ribosomal protein S17E